MRTLTLATKVGTAQIKLHYPPELNDKPLRILCATDLWARSDEAVQRAIALAGACDAELLLLHVVEGEAPLRILGRRADRAQSALNWRLRQQSSLPVRPEISVRIGRPHRTIERVARDWRADLVVLGAYRPRTADWLFGTTAERLAAFANCAVLVVKRSAVKPYSEAAVVAENGAAADLLHEGAAHLQIVDPRLRCSRAVFRATPRRIQIRAPSPVGGADARTDFNAALRTLIHAAPELIIVGVDRRSAALRLVGRSMANAVIRRGASDVLVAPAGFTVQRLRERFGPLLRRAA